MDETQRVELEEEQAQNLLVMISEFHTLVLDQWHCGERENDEVAEICYLLGNIEGRLIYNGLNQDDLDLLECWQEELEEDKNGD